jgi:hypothetical protein
MADRLTQRDIELLKKLRSGDRITSVDMKKIQDRAKLFADRVKDDASNRKMFDKDAPRKLSVEEEIIQKIRQRAPKKKAVGGLMGKGLAPAGLGAIGRGLSPKGFGMNEKLKKVKDRIKKDIEDLKEFKKKRKKQYNKPAIPLGKMEKKSGPKPGSMDYFLLDQLKPGYKVAPMSDGGKVKKPMGYDKGGMCRGMGAAVRGGNFKGVK